MNRVRSAAAAFRRHREPRRLFRRAHSMARKAGGSGI